MLPRSKAIAAQSDANKDKPAKRINISKLRGEARQEMWKKIQAEHPALAADLQDGACARIRAEFPGIAVIVPMDDENRILTERPRKTKP